MNKNKVMIITIIIIIICLLTIILFNTLKIGYNELISLEERTLKNCYNEKCPVKYYDNYDLIELNEDIKELKEKVDKINKDTNKYYNKAKKSKISSNDCKNIKAKEELKLKYRVYTDYYLYENDKYISVSIKRIENEICENKFITHNVESYIYDKEKKKIVTQEEFQKDNKIDKTVIKKAIARGIGSTLLDLEENDSKREENIKYELAKGENLINNVFYNSDGVLYISYFVKDDNTCYITPVYKEEDE